VVERLLKKRKNSTSALRGKIELAGAIGWEEKKEGGTHHLL